MDKFWQIDFSDEYLTNVEVIDKAHKNLAMKANKLYEMSTGLNIKEADLVKYIEDCKNEILGHFEEEIAFYKKHNLTEIEEHKIKHHVFACYLNDLESIPRPILIKALMMNQILLRYLTQHFDIEDKKCIENIKKYID